MRPEPLLKPLPLRSQRSWGNAGNIAYRTLTECQSAQCLHHFVCSIHILRLQFLEQAGRSRRTAAAGQQHSREGRAREERCPAHLAACGSSEWLWLEPECTFSWFPPHSINTDENRYPQKLAVAECLCRGCINAKTGRETGALNSVQLLQSLLVLRRQPCSRDGMVEPTPGSFAFHTEFIRVPVGCTCVLPRSTQ